MVLDHFSSASGLKINFDKSVLVALGKWEPDWFSDTSVSEIKKTTISSGFTYLGLHLLNNLHIMAHNYGISLQVPLSIMENRAVCSMGVLGCMLQIKQLVASMFVYRFTLLPSPHASHMKVLDHAYFDYTWNHKCHRLNKEIMCQPLNRGSFNMLNVYAQSRSLKLS